MQVNEATAEAQPPPPTPLGYALLTLVVDIGRPTYAGEIVRIVRARGGALGKDGSTINRTLKRLAADGYLDEEVGELKRAKGRVLIYHRTPQGVNALRQWAETPATTPRADISELIPRLRAARLVPAKALLRSLRPLRESLEDELDDLRRFERQATKAEDWDSFVQLEFDLRRRQLRADADWTDSALVLLERLAKEQAPWPETEGEVDAWIKKNKEAMR